MKNLNLTKSLLLLLYISVTRLKSVKCYSQISISGSNATNAGPKIYKAMNLDLIFPKTFNSSESLTQTTTTLTSTTIRSPPSEAVTNVETAIFVTPPSINENAPVVPSSIVENLETPQQWKQQQQEQMFASTGRAVNYHPTYPFSQLLAATNLKNPPKRLSTFDSERQRPASSGINRMVYPNSYTNGYPMERRPSNPTGLGKFTKNAQLMDRFSPSEGVASHKFKNNHDHHNHNHHYPTSGSDFKVAAPSNQVITSYKPPKNLYSFPPNLNAIYPAPGKDPKTALPSNSITSYLPPPSGPLTNGASNGPGYVYTPPASPAAPVMPPSNNNAGYSYDGPVAPPTGTAETDIKMPPSDNSGYSYPGPVAPSTGPADSEFKMPTDDETKAADDGNGDTDDTGNDDTIGVLPASAMDMAAASGDDAKAMAGGDDMPAGMDMNMDDHDHDHHPLTGYDSDKEYPTPPPGWLEDHPDAAHDHPHHHDHDHSHDHFPSFSAWSGPSYPEIIYDDHYHHHHHPEPPPTTLPPITTIPPPVEPPPEPRVKKYSYFYIGRKLWYIPLYFTVWFSFYVLWLILKSIARHKVNLPNHYVNRRSLPEFTPPEKTKEYIDKLTVAVLAKIDGFKDKYLL